MYGVAGRLDPDGYLALARATYGEMVLAGITCVGEFHYLHHAPGGDRYDDPNAMGHALVQAAREAGLRMTLLDTCYLAGGIGEPLARRAARGSATATRTPGRRGPRHCTRRTPAPATSWSARPCTRCGPCRPTSSAPSRPGPPDHEAPLHAHVSEQPRENDALPAGLRRDADPAAARPRRARPAHAPPCTPPT